MKLHKIICCFLFLGSFSLAVAQKTTETVEQNREVSYYLIEAKNSLSQGNVQKAISLYNKCIALKKDCATAHYELANVAIVLKDLDVALEHSRAAATIAPQNAWYQLQLAEIMEGRGMLKQAAETYLYLAKLEMQNPFYLQKSVMLFETTENWEKALEAYGLMEKEYGEDFNLLVRKQALYAKAGRKDEGIAELKKLVKENPKNSEFQSLLAMSYQENGELKKADKIYDKIAGLETISGVSQMVLHRYYMSIKEYPKAFESLKKAIASEQVEEGANVGAVINLLQKDTTAQAKIYRTELSSLLIEKYPENAVGYLFKAQEYGENKEYEEAKSTLDKALDIDPTNYNGLAQLSLLQNIGKDWEALYETAKTGIKYYPQEHLFYVFKGLAASQKEEYLVAESSLTTGYLYAKEDDAKEDIQELLADVYYKSGKVDKSFDLFEELLGSNPDNQMVLNNYAYFLSLENKDLDKAEKLSKKTVDAEPKNATYLDTYAWILHQKGKYREALQCMEKAIDNLGEEEASSEMWEHYGDILLKLGNAKQAVEEWQKALTLPDPKTERLKKKIAENK